MSVSPPFRYIRCDGPHVEVFQVDGADLPVKVQRSYFSTEGWHHWRGLDLCGGCWPSRHQILEVANGG